MARSRNPEASMEGRQRKRDRTRERLVDEAFTLFEKKGYDATTVEEIATAADVTSRTFFRYFSNKEDVILLGQASENRQIEKMIAARQPHQTELEFLVAATEAITDWSPEMLERAKRSRRIILATPALRSRERGFTAEIEELLARGLTPPRARKSEALRIQMLVAAYLATMSTLMNAYLRGEVRGMPDAHREQVAELLRHGFER